MKRLKTFKRVAIALPLCLGAPLVAAQTLDQAISVGATAAETSVDALQGIKKFKPSDFNRALGNNATRKVWANWVNGKISSALEVAKTSRLPLLALGLEAAESGAEALGNLYEGNLTGAGAIAVNTAVTNITVTGGAIAGGKLFAYVGAVAGAWVPVVGPVAGGVVGGVVGSVGGAVVASVAIGSDSVTNWVGSTFEGYSASGRRVGKFTGRIEGNQISGTWVDSFRFDGLVNSNCTGSVLMNGNTNIELTLNARGSMTGRIIGGNQKVRVTGCPDDDVNRTDTIPPATLQGRWKIRE